MHNSKPLPLFYDASANRQRCPVCGSVAYSREGIHPQCAMQLADSPRMERLKKLALIEKAKLQ